MWEIYIKPNNLSLYYCTLSLYFHYFSSILLQYNDASVGVSQFTVMTDRSQGGASLNDGQLEIMVSKTYVIFQKRSLQYGKMIKELFLYRHH